jgi:hypothetical protein
MLKISVPAHPVVYVTVNGPELLPAAIGLGGVPVRHELFKVISAIAEELEVFWIETIQK